MEGVFGKNAGPRGILSGPLPIFGSSDSHPLQSEPIFGNNTSVNSQQINPGKSDLAFEKNVPTAKRPDTQFPTKNSYLQTVPRQNLPPPSRPDIHSRLTYLGTNAEKVAIDPGFYDVSMSKLSEQTRSPAQIFPRSVSTSVTQTSYSHATAANRNRSPVSQHDLGSQSAFQAPAGDLSKEMRLPIHEFSRSDKPSRTEMRYQTDPGKSMSPTLEPDFIPGSQFQINSGRRPIAYTDSIFYGNSDEPPRRSQIPPPENLRPVDPSIMENSYQDIPTRNRKRLPGQNENLGSRSAYLAPKRSVANSDLPSDGAGESSKRIRSPVHEIPSVEPSRGNQLSKDNQSPCQINTGRKPVAYTDSIFDDTSVEPSRGNQFFKDNQFPPVVQPRRNVLPQTSHKKNVATQKSGKLSDLKALPSPLHAVDNSGTRSLPLLAEREEEAKKRRLARFGAELSQPVVELVETPVSNAESSKQQADIDFSEASAIVGLCPDMCPAPERGERERKGDLDKQERLDGDRNQTTKFLAVKKYTRTAERDPDLIRPLPVLMKTMDYLLELLNKPYGNDFLGLYNFLWDRMRAVRMDLRMQHIFNLEAISMLEQMIRLHIIAMHELCEYNKGQGFSEGFDAHLNIEQMNKALVELFQMYEDHRRKGISVPTEREFRGYYALLKLDKHPGYKVEPAELSLDLAKMSPEVRRSPEVAFARDVAKASRAGNYISFFRLAKKATYLQACLMHAHFLKLRTEALASLHSSFPSNQGMPLARLVDMLAMEGEDVESFVENYGLVLKSFNEMYIVKDGPFLRQEGDPLSKWSTLVGNKRSHTIKLDVCFTPGSSTTKEEVSDALKVAETKRVSPKKPDMAISDSPRPVKVLDQTQRVLLPVRGPQEVDKQAAFVPERPIDVQAVPLLPLPSPPVCTGSVPVMQAANAHRVVMPKLSAPVSLPPSSNSAVHVTSSVNASSDQKVSSIKKCEVEMVLAEKKSREKMELIKERLKLKPIIRKWRKRAKEMRLLREKKERKTALVREAMESLSVGPLLSPLVIEAPRKETELLNIDRAIRTRLRKQEKSWSLLKMSELVTPILAEQNPEARCLCWKLFLSLPAGPSDSLPTKWLLTKFNLKEAGSFVSIFKTWSGPHLSLSFVRADITGSAEKNSVAGASSILFLLSGDTALEAHKARLHNLFNQIPARSNLPLLIVIGDGFYGEEETAIIAKLGIADVDQTKLRGISVIFLNHDPQSESTSNGLFDDGTLRGGVRWLAEHSPLQSEVSLVNTRTILLSYLKPKLEVLGDAYEMGPDQCITAINESIDWLISAILGSASANPNFWPCPETDLLEKSSSEKNYAEMTLPRATWSDPQKIQAQIDALNGCKLPCFGFDLSWLSQGSNCADKKKVQDQRTGLEECLFNYLNLFAGSHQAMDEARNLVRRCTSLVLHNSCFYLAPKWTAIFRRLLNLRLLEIAKDASDVYIYEDVAFNAQWRDLLVTNELPFKNLDEMIESCFIVDADTAVPTIPAMSDVHTEVHEETRADEEYGVVHNVYAVPDNAGLPKKEKKQSMLLLRGKFAALLDQCTTVQDDIDKKLYIYF
ncbi:Germinal-center associated nuclear protein [Carex littledalei]|uniref:Germinal-center associated nuclear protein n=1 Tax=Carex littledalei TaxID=544730 RepID=A0A833QV74_9POAL|nr:Germinal-center associated nuclear protein [Carex littledalei]